jgi:branched-chain amino acid transport system permease protein
MYDFLQYLLDGLAIGSVYSLIAVGYSLVFGVLRMVNFAHGEFFMLGAYLFMFFFNLKIPLWISFVLSALFVGMLSVGMERFLYKPLRKSGRFAPLIMAVGLSLFLQNFVQIIFSPNPQSFPVSLPEGIIQWGEDILIRKKDIYIFVITLVLTFVFDAFIRFTSFGRAIRAVSMQPQAAMLVGIPFNRIISITFFLGAVMAVVGGVMQGMSTNQIWPFMGVHSGLKAFAAAVLGGTGELWGAVLGGFFIGISESLLVGYDLSMYKDGLAYLILVVFLLYRPQGILGKKLTVKV